MTKWNKRNTKDVGPNKKIPQGSDNHSSSFFHKIFATGPSKKLLSLQARPVTLSPISLHQANSHWLNSSIILLEAFLIRPTPTVSTHCTHSHSLLWVHTWLLERLIKHLPRGGNSLSRAEILLVIIWCEASARHCANLLYLISLWSEFSPWNREDLHLLHLYIPRCNRLCQVPTVIQHMWLWARRDR